MELECGVNWLFVSKKESWDGGENIYRIYQVKRDRFYKKNQGVVCIGDISQ